MITILRAENRRCWVVCVVLFLGTLAWFSRAVPHGFIDLDDGDYVTENPQVQAGLSWAGMRWALTANVAANWHPLTLVSHMLDCQLFGGNAHGHHATSVLWHALNAVLVFLVFRRLTGAFWASALAAALFAWHPLRVESVAWVAERKDVLSGFFGLLTLWAYAGYAQRQIARSGGAALHYAFALAAFMAGLVCKPMLVTLPFLLLLLDYWPLERFHPPARLSPMLPLLTEKIPFFLLSGASALLTFFYQQAAGAVGDGFSFGQRLANALVSVVRYLAKFFWPFDLATGYALPQHWPLPEGIGALLLVVAITIFALWQWRRRPWLFVGWLWFLGMLVPVSGLVQVGLQAMADRYTYLPIQGVELMVLWSLRELFRSPMPPWVKPVAVALLLAGCGLRTWNQLGLWSDSRTLHEHALAVSRDNYLANFYLGTTLLNQEQPGQAVPFLRRALELKPDFRADHYRLGVALQEMGCIEEAMDVFRDVLKHDPGYAVADYSLGALLLELKRPREAIPHFRAVLNAKPDYVPGFVAMGTAWSDLGRPQDALPNFQQAVALTPSNAPAQYDWANALVDLHRVPEALIHYRKAIQLDPTFEMAYCNLGNALRSLGQFDAACVQYREALQLRPGDAAAHYGLGAALEELGKTDAAQAGYREAIQLKPDYAEAQCDLAVLLLNQNQAADALSHFEAAARNQPENATVWFGLGLALARLGRHTEAIECYQRVLSISPERADALCSIGVALRRLGRPAEAISYQEHALRLEPNDAQVHAELGQALYQTGHAAEALSHLEQALKLHPGFPGVPELIAKVRTAEK
jgi:protein O-mannosyl-transferase